MAEPIRVLLVDDQRLVREGLRTLLELETDLQVAGEAENGLGAVELYANLQPDVVLMDIRMPMLDGVAATRQLCEAWPAARILILTTFDDDDYVLEGIRAGALGYMLKDVSGAELANAVRTIAVGGSVMGASVARKVLAHLGKAAPPKVAPLLEPLSEREEEILALMAQGRNNPEIAQHLHLAQGTVKNYVSNILQKLDVRDRAQAVLRAQALGLL
ncbi:MAG: response regulator transcription factor [Caldilineaceae bacterium]